MPNICKCGCLRPCEGEYFNRHDRWNTTRRAKEDYRIEDRGYLTPCWIWQLKISKAGYASMKMGGRDLHAHNYYYEKYVGPLPPNTVPDHLCRVRCCVNFDHLEPVSNAENIRRGIGTKLTAADALEIVARYRGGSSMTDIAKDFPVSLTQVHDVIHGIRWADVVGDLREVRNVRRSLSSEDVVEIRGQRTLGVSPTILAARFKVSIPTIYRAATRKYYQGVA